MTCATRGCKRRGVVAGRCRSHARARADEAFSRFIRNRDGMCLECGTRQNLTCAHLVSRRYSATRWDPSNAVALCWSDHFKFGLQPLEWDLWCERHLGAEAWAELKRRAVEGERAVSDSWLEVYAA